MKRSFICSTLLLLAAFASTFASTTLAAEKDGVLGYPKDEPIDVCPQELVGYETLAVIDFSDENTTTDGWQARDGVEISRGENALEIVGDDEDPYFFSPMFPAFLTPEQMQKTVGKTLVKMRIRRENKGVGQIFYAMEKEPGYSEKNASTFKLANDTEWHDYLVALDVASPILRLRFDIGGSAGLAELGRVELISVRYKPVKFGTHTIDQGTLTFNFLNNDIEPETVDTKYYGVHPRRSYPSSRIKIEDRALVDLYFPQKRAFEEVEVVATTQSTKETFSRRFFAFNESAADNALISGVGAPTLRNDELEVRFAADASGAEIFREGKRVAVITPLVAEEGDGAAILPVKTDFSKIDLDAEVASNATNADATRIVPVFRSVNGDSIDFDLVRVPVDVARAKLNAVAKATTDHNPLSEEKKVEKKETYDPSAICGSLKFRLDGDLLKFDFDAPCKVNAPVLRVLGEMEQAILSGSEYLEKGERSSSVADIETSEHIRYAQPIDWTTAPFASVVTDRASISMLYDDAKKQSIFAVPDFIDGDAASSRMNLCAEQGSGCFRVAPALEPIEKAILWSVKTRGLPELPVPPRTGREQAEYILAGFEKSCLKTPQGWGHAIIGPEPPYHYTPHWGSDFISTIWEISGKLPETPAVAYGGGHIPNYVSLLLTGNAQLMKDRLTGIENSCIALQQADGSYRFKGEYLRSAQYDYASGDCGNRLYELMAIWRLTKHDNILPVVKKGLDFVNKLKTPAGAQTWELSLHTPDIMGSSRCVLANVMYYEATGEKEYLDAAARWALTGIPFVYLWEDPDITPGKQPMMRYATIAVYGATNWTAPNWMGRPVQWCGLDYAHALILLSKHDDTLDWGKIAEGIVASAECQLADNEFIGLLPDSFQLATQEKYPSYINPSAVWLLRRMIDGEPTNVSVVDCNGRRVVSPFQASVEGNKVKIAGVKGMTYQVLIDGVEIKTIESQGEDVLEF